MVCETHFRVTADMLVDDLMSEHAALIPVFIRRTMYCVGCPVGQIHTVRDACIEHGIVLGEFLDELNAALDAAD